jgi:hypothetical protein
MPFIGNQPAQSYSSFAKQDFTTSATTSYTLDYPVANENEVALFINFVRQEPTTAYTASGTSLTLTSATSASDDMYAVFIGKAVQTVNPPAGSVDSSKINYPLTTFSSTGIDDNATSTAITIDSSQNVGIGTTSVGSELHVVADDVSQSWSAYDGTVLTIENNDTDGCILQTVGRNTATNEIWFGDDDSRNIGRIRYEHSDDGLEFWTNNSERMRIDSSGNVGIGTTTIPEVLTVDKSSNGAITGLSINNNYPTASTASAGTGSGIRFGVNDGSFNSAFGDARGSEILSVTTSSNGRSRDIVFKTDTSGSLGEKMRITSAGDVLIGKTTLSSTTPGINFFGIGAIEIIRNIASGGACMLLNRQGSDGTLILFQQANVTEGSISVSGSTVSYNGFTGTHWSRFTDNSKPTILKGTVLESLDEMCDWYNLEFDVITTTQDEDGNDVTNTHTEKVPHVLADGQSDGDVITYNHEGTDYQATIVKENDVKHMKSKVSDTVDAKNVYGVFSAYDNDGEGYNDFYVASVGSFVVRIKANETIAKGDLLQSNGDGTAKVQTDDAVRSSSFAKVLSTTVIETYEDGSYLVPCSLMC